MGPADPMFYVYLNIIPDIFRDLFQTKSQNKYTMRSHEKLAEPYKKIKLSKFSISYRRPHLRNTTIVYIKELNGIKDYFSFKRKLKEYIFSNNVDAIQYLVLFVLSAQKSYFSYVLYHLYI